MPRVRLDQVRPGDWLVHSPSRIKEVGVVHLTRNSTGQQWITLNPSTIEEVRGSAADEVEIAIAPPEVGLVWDDFQQVWMLTVDTDMWPDSTPLEVIVDGGVVFNPVHAATEATEVSA